MTTSTLTLTVVDPVVGTITVTNTFQSSDVPNILAAYQQEANVAVNGSATPQQILAVLWQGIIADVLRKTQQFEHQQAIAAVQPPPLISYN